MAVVNPSNGPGWGSDPNFYSGIKSLQAAGIDVLGYVASNYASVPQGTVETEVQDYVSWYGVNGVYIDQMANWPGAEWYYSGITNYAHSIGAWFVAGNPGADVPSSYIGTVDTIVIYENAGLPSLGFLGGWHTSYAKSNFAVVAYGDSFDQSYIQSASGYLGWIFTTDAGWPNPYGSLPSYLGSLLSTVAGSAPVPQTSPTTSPTPAAGSGGPGTISVVTISRSSGEIYGIYTTLWENGALVSSCFSPCTFSVSGSTNYSVAVSNYASYYYASWADGSLPNFYSVSEPATPTNLILTAFYN